MIRINPTGDFDDSYREFVRSDPELKSTILSHMLWFRKNPADSRLRNHKLTGRMKGKWVFSVTNDIRIVYTWVGKQAVRLLAVGRHPDVYPKSG